MGSAPGDQQVGPARGAVRDRRRELGAFLRSRRARLRPAEVGLADWGVRRVPGLRREEVAQLANVGLTWYTLGPGPCGPANMLDVGFTDPHWRTLIADWEQEAARHVAMYRAAMTVHLDDPAWTALPARLARLSPDFARFWASSDVAGPERRLKRFRHPSAGPLTLHSTSLLMADDPMIRIVILYPATASDAAKLARLAR
jgi:hypothetical protein